MPTMRLSILAFRTFAGCLECGERNEEKKRKLQDAVLDFEHQGFSG